MSETITTPKDAKALVQWKGEPITITAQDVKNFICPLATEQEIAIFLKTCQSLQLNPFANECFLVKYDVKDKAAFIISIDSYLKAAETNPNYDGCEAGIILKDSDGKLELREGAFILNEDLPRLVGGWAKVYRKDRGRPTYVAVNKNECIKYTNKGALTAFWSELRQPWMLRKVALKRALVEAFPSLFAGTLATVEVESDVEGTLPAAFDKNGTPDWPQFWAKVQNELGLTQKEVHDLLGVESLKTIIGNEQTLETIWNSLVQKIQERQKDSVPFEPMEENFDTPTTLPPIDMAWLSEGIRKTQWTDIVSYVKRFPEAKGAKLGEAIASLTREHQEELCKELQKRLDAQIK